MGHKKNIFIGIGLGAVALAAMVGIVRVMATGPTGSAGSGYGAISTDAYGDVGIGTSTIPASNPSPGRVFIVATTTVPYTIEILPPTGVTPNFKIDNSGNVTAATFAGALNGTVGANNVSNGIFGAGNFGFPASLGINTSSQIGLPQPLSVYGNGYISGSLGIGTSSPSGKFLIFDTTGETYNVVNNAGGDSNAYIQSAYGARTIGTGAALSFMIPANSDGSNPWDQGRILVTPDNANNGDASGRMYLQTRGCVGSCWSWTNNLVLTSNGNVGVATTSTAFPLTVGGQVSATGYCINGVNCISSWPSGVSLAAANTWTGVQTFSATTDLNGSVDIAGTNGPLLQKLEIDGNGTGAAGAALDLNESGVRSWYIGAGHGVSGKLAIGSGSGGDVMTFDGNNYVGIGTTNPTFPLTVNGTANVTGELYVNNNGSGTGSGSVGNIQLGDGVINKTYGTGFTFNSSAAFAGQLTATTIVDSGLASQNCIGTSAGGTLQAGVCGATAVSAGNITSGVFGALQGNGNFAFPANLGVNTASQVGLPQALSVYGGGYFSGNVGVGTAAPGNPLSVNGTINAGGNYYNVLTYNLNNTPTNGVKIKTNIPYTSGAEMPTIIIEGYNYGTSEPIGLILNWYVYSNAFTSYKVSSFGGDVPSIQLSDEGGYVVIFLNERAYYERFTVQVYSTGMSETPSWFNGWSAVDQAVTGTNTVTVPYENDFAGNVFFPGSGVWNSSGYVGIGTASPATALQVNGTVTATTFSGAGTGLTGTAASLTAGVANTFTAANGLPYSVWMNANGAGSRNWYVGAADMYWELGGAGSFHFRNSSDVDVATISAAGVGSFAAGTTVGGTNICLTNGTNCPASGSIGGSGTAGYIGKFTAGTTLGNSEIYDNGSAVGVGQTSPNGKFDVATNGSNDGIVFYQPADNSSDIQSYIDGQWAARATYASGCCNTLNIDTDAGDVHIGSSGHPVTFNGGFTSNTNSTVSGTLTDNGETVNGALTDNGETVNGSVNSNSYVYGNELYTRDNVYLAYEGNWMSNVLNQSVVNGASPTFGNVYLTATDALDYWGGGTPYRTWMDNSATYHYGSVQDYAIHFTMDGEDSGRGFTWGANGSQPSMSVDVNGNLTLKNNLSVGNKITATTFDPVYTIGGTNYATYLPGMTGVKEETAGTLDLRKNSDGSYSTTIDFSNEPTGGDVWLFAKATNMPTAMSQLIVNLTPSFSGNVWYEKNATLGTLTIHGSAAGEVSYNLTAPRFDASQWTNIGDPNAKGLLIK